MLKWIKKHWICSIAGGIIILGFIYPYIVGLLIMIEAGRYWHPIVMTQPSKTVFEYKLPNTTYPVRCLELALDIDDINRKYPVIDSEFKQKFRFRVWEDMSDEEYLSHTQGKPHFIAHIYQAGELKDTQEMYMMSRELLSGAYVGGFKITTLYRLAGYNKAKQRACYTFLPDIVYTIEVISQTPLAAFEDIDAFVGMEVKYIPK